MKLTISNIAWNSNHDEEMYLFLSKQDSDAIEIAPTRIFPENPYQKLNEATEFSKKLKTKFGLKVCSIQSIWYGKTQGIFNSIEERKSLLEYTKDAICFAEAIGCQNIVFGCPKNRRTHSDDDVEIAYAFFRELGEFASNHGTVIALEPNPVIYNTNFLNQTSEAFDFCRKLNIDGLKVNVDLGTSIFYDEKIADIQKNIDLVNHIHISEPMLAPVSEKNIHHKLKNILFEKYASIEMSTQQNVEDVKKVYYLIKNILNPD